MRFVPAMTDALARRIAADLEAITFDSRRPGCCSCGGDLVEPADHHTDVCDLVIAGHLPPRSQLKHGSLVPWAPREIN